jgi:hypothetical protein
VKARFSEMISNKFFDKDLSSSSDDEKPEKNDENEENEKKEVVELKITKRQNRTKPLNEEVLTSNDGLLRVYEEFPSACRFHGRGSEKEDLKRLMDTYRFHNINYTHI